MSQDADMRSEFVAEAQDIIDSLNHDLLEAETQVRTGAIKPDLINQLFRSAHSLKGVSGMFGLDPVSRLAHHMESLLDAMRLGRVHVDASALDSLFACVERFGVIVAAVEAGSDPQGHRVNDLIARLEELSNASGVGAGDDALAKAKLPEEVLKVLTEYEEHRLRDNLESGNSLFMLHSVFNLDSFDVGLEEIEVALRERAEVITKLPSSQDHDPGLLAFDILIGTALSGTEIAQALDNESIKIRDIFTAEAKPHVEVADVGQEENSTLRSVARTVRVDIRRLDRLMNLVGELALTKTEIQRVSERMRHDGHVNPLAASLHRETRSFERRLAELQAGIMEVRMVPVANMFERMMRVARKIGRDVGRRLRVELEGESTELDKLIVEDLADPLMHILRNGIDHGIEPEDERARLGKPPEGTIRLSAAAQGNHVIVTVEDDGRGIDTQRVLEIATKRGLVSAEKAKELTEREIHNLLFMPGFSTRTQVSEMSGRGVGMDVVKTNVSKLSGVIDIESRVGSGTKFTITLPITLAIIPALIVKSAGVAYALPIYNIRETLSLATNEIQTIDGNDVLSLRGQTVPLLDLRATFGLGGRRPDTFFAIVASIGRSLAAIVVDEVEGQQDIVIKTLGARLRRVPGIAGAAELSNQKTILVIDVVDLLNEIGQAEKTPSAAEHRA